MKTSLNIAIDEQIAWRRALDDESAPLLPLPERARLPPPYWFGWAFEQDQLPERWHLIRHLEIGTCLSSDALLWLVLQDGLREITHLTLYEPIDGDVMKELALAAPALSNLSVSRVQPELMGLLEGLSLTHLSLGDAPDRELLSALDPGLSSLSCVGLSTTHQAEALPSRLRRLQLVHNRMSDHALQLALKRVGPALESLYLHDSREELGAFDLDLPNPGLQRLTLSGFRAWEPRALHAFAGSLRQLDCTDLAAPMAIPPLEKLQRLSLRKPADDAPSRALHDVRGLEVLELRSLATPMCEALDGFLRTQSSLRHLALESCIPEDLLGVIVDSGVSLERLELRGPLASAESLSRLGECHTLEHLVLEDLAPGGDVGGGPPLTRLSTFRARSVLLSSGLLHTINSGGLRHLELPYSSLSDDAAPVLADLIANSELMSLDLSHLRNGVESLIDALTLASTHLRVLDLTHHQTWTGPWERVCGARWPHLVTLRVGESLGKGHWQQWLRAEQVPRLEAVEWSVNGQVDAMLRTLWLAFRDGVPLTTCCLSASTGVNDTTTWDRLAELERGERRVVISMA